MSVITSLTKLANHPIKINISKIDKVKNRLFSLLPQTASGNNCSDLLKRNLLPVFRGRPGEQSVAPGWIKSAKGFAFVEDCLCDLALTFLIQSQMNETSGIKLCQQIELLSTLFLLLPLLSNKILLNQGKNHVQLKYSDIFNRHINIQYIVYLYCIYSIVYLFNFLLIDIILEDLSTTKHLRLTSFVKHFIGFLNRMSNCFPIDGHLWYFKLFPTQYTMKILECVLLCLRQVFFQDRYLEVKFLG